MERRGGGGLNAVCVSQAENFLSQKGQWLSTQ